MARKVLTLLSEKTAHQVTINKVQVSWLDRANLQDILIRDLKNDTLLYSKNLAINYEILDLINGEYLNVEEIASDGLRMKLMKYDSAAKLNLSLFIQALKKDKVKKKSKPININQISLSNLHLTLNDKTKKPTPTKLDFANLNFSIPDFNISKLTINADTITGNILQMRGDELNSGFTIEDFNTVFRVSNESLSIDDLYFKTPTSHIADSLEFFYTGLEDFGTFVDSVSFILHFKDSKISKEDMKIVLGIDAVKDDLTIDGILWGTVGDFNIEDVRFGYGKSYFVGGLSCFGLPDLKKTFILADLTDSHVVPSDLEPYIGDYAQNLKQMGKIDFTGSFAGFLNDFVARGDFVTNQGSVHSDINLKIPGNAANMSYDGSLEFRDVNVGAFFQNDLVQKVNLKATIKGRGIKPENADFELKALVYNSGLKGYTYDSIEADGKFAKNYFEGSFSVHDPNCVFYGSATLDLNQSAELVKVNLEVEKFNADSLKLTSRNIAAKGKLDLEIKDLNIDDFSGRLAIDSGLFSLDEKDLVLDSIRLNAGFRDSTRFIDLVFPGFKSDLHGEFKISDAIKDIPKMASGYASKLQLEADTAKRVGSGENYKLFLNAQISDITPYIDSLKLPISVVGQTIIESSFRQSKNVNVSFFAKTDTLIIGKNKFHNPVLELNGSKDSDASDILTNFLFESDRQIIPRVPDTEDLLLEGVWLDDNIDITTSINQTATASSVRIESNLKLYGDSLILKMLPSDIQLLDDNWNFNPSNRVTINKKEITISNLEIYDSSESIAVEGVLADSVQTSIIISTEDLNMDKVGLFSDAEISGFLNGNFKLFRKDVTEAFRFDGAFLLKNLKYNDLEVGDVSGSSRWNPVNKSVYSKVTVERKDVNAIQVKGYYYPQKENDQLDFDVTFDEAELKMVAPFIANNFSDIEGVANGTLKLTGTGSFPRVIGSCRIENGGVTINYLNTHYKFNGKLDFDPKIISLQNFDLMDRKGANAGVEGVIKHDFFKDFVLDLKVRANNFEFLNTTALDNSLYYGSAYGSGVIDFEGALNDIKINANVRTEADTRFYIPISDGQSIGQEDYITFVNFTDTTANTIVEDFKISGITLDFDIDVTPDAYCELIFDIKTGDIIRGRGSGSLKLTIDSDGEFHMFGPLEITEGAYNFTVPNLLNKEFDVAAGSRITWYGEPYNATLDIDANYVQRASFEGLEDPEEQDPTELSNKVPILVILKIEGGMLSPNIDFDLELQNPSDANSSNIPLLSQIKNDEQELKRQVISLLFLRRFSPQQSFTLSGGGTVGNSVSEFLSSQVSYLVSQIDENLEVEVDLSDLNNEAFNTFQLRFAYTFLNGRLKVTRGGDFGNPDDNRDNVVNDIVGDWSVEYSLTKDGMLRAKVFRNSSQRILANQNRQNLETGVSLRFVHSFNDLSDILSKSRDDAIRRREDEEQVKQEEPEAEPDTTKL